MNAKKSKALRLMAKVAAEGLPYLAYEETTQGGPYITLRNGEHVKNNTVALAACVRAVYQGFKRNVK